MVSFPVHFGISVFCGVVAAFAWSRGWRFIAGVATTCCFVSTIMMAALYILLQGPYR